MDNIEQLKAENEKLKQDYEQLCFEFESLKRIKEKQES